MPADRTPPPDRAPERVGCTDEAPCRKPMLRWCHSPICDYLTLQERADEYGRRARLAWDGLTQPQRDTAAALISRQEPRHVR